MAVQLLAALHDWTHADNQRILRLRCHWSSALILLASALNGGQHSKQYSIIVSSPVLYSCRLVLSASPDLQMQLSHT